jgi:hypothetical protein
VVGPPAPAGVRLICVSLCPKLTAAGACGSSGPASATRAKAATPDDIALVRLLGLIMMPSLAGVVLVFTQLLACCPTGQSVARKRQERRVEFVIKSKPLSKAPGAMLLLARVGAPGFSEWVAALRGTLNATKRDR